uniref:Protein YIPF n=1 Tax=Panagrellus redivivus TaxID=6233 RepID=A0A7E4V9D2_PANRE
MSDLNFQSFDSPFTGADNPNNDYRPASSTKDSSNLITDGNINSDPNATSAQGFPSATNIFSFKFYQQYFDVDQETVQARLLRALVPNPKSNFILDHIKPLPDMYGPLWICVTLVFSTAICGNLAHYIENHGENGPAYENDFTLVTGATSLVASYVVFVPFFLYWALWYRHAAVQYSYLELLSLYGYSLAVFVPVSVLWVVHFHLFRWALIIAAMGISSLLLFNAVWPAVQADPNRAAAFGIVGGTLFLHLLLGITFKAYYFDSVIPAKHTNDVNIPAPYEAPTANVVAEKTVPNADAQVAPAPSADTKADASPNPSPAAASPSGDTKSTDKEKKTKR